VRYNRGVPSRDETIGSADTLASVEPGEGEVGGAAGRLVAGRYRLLRLLGHGGMGEVYLAADQELDELVALKTIRGEGTSHEATELLRREAKLARRVTHPNVARTFDFGEHEGGRFLTMEYVDGEPLSAILGRDGPLPVDRGVRVVRDVAEGLHAAHEAGVIHRDVKPENVLVARSGRVVISDFGIAGAIDRPGAA
jgi:eukaryotic-like serine/threonine-protein kinase